MQNINRSSGLDILRSLAIIFVFMSHYDVFAIAPIFGIFGKGGGVGVDLFFVLSGYLIGNQLFSTLIKNNFFSIKNFYLRRILRTWPTYLVMVGIYFSLPSIIERPLYTPLWKFLTFTQNFNLSYTGFSHAWSLCIEEQFYLILPLLTLFFVHKKYLKRMWILMVLVFLSEILIRGIIWQVYLSDAGENLKNLYVTKIYYPTFCRLDGLSLGILLALLKNFHKNTWEILTPYGNLFLIIGIVGYCFIFYVFQQHSSFLTTTFSYSILALSSASLVFSALSTHSILYNFYIPGALYLAIGSYAVYLTHKICIHSIAIIFAKYSLQSNLLSFASTVLLSACGAWILYRFVEKPFLKLRDKLTKYQRKSELISTEAV